MTCLPRTNRPPKGGQKRNPPGPWKCGRCPPRGGHRPALRGPWTGSGDKPWTACGCPQLAPRPAHRLPGLRPQFHRLAAWRPRLQSQAFFLFQPLLRPFRACALRLPCPPETPGGPSERFPSWKTQREGGAGQGPGGGRRTPPGGSKGRPKGGQGGGTPPPLGGTNLPPAGGLLRGEGEPPEGWGNPGRGAPRSARKKRDNRAPNLRRWPRETAQKLAEIERKRMH